MSIWLRQFFFVMLTMIGMWPVLAEAKSDHELLNELGIYGNWAVDCSRGVTEDNLHFVFVPPSNGGNPVKMTLWPNRSIRSEIRNIEFLGNNSVRWIEARPDGLSLTLTILHERDRMRTTESASSDGKVYIKDGFMLLANRPTNWLKKCSTDTSTPRRKS